MARVAYRRLSGKIGLTDTEKGTRGLWWEKRKYLLKALADRGHNVEIVSPMTTESLGLSTDYAPPYDVLVIEFGGLNKVFYGDQINSSLQMINAHKGLIIFVCDDPDLPFPWTEIDNSKSSQFVCWYNCTTTKKFSKEPKNVTVKDMPFASLVSKELLRQESLDYQKDFLVYVGRPNGRKKVFANLLANQAPIRIFGRPKEWEIYGQKIYEAPDQPVRSIFYGQQLGSLCVADAKHKELGWRTGRAFHAINANCPAVFEHDHKAFVDYKTFRSAQELKDIVKKWSESSEARFIDLNRQKLLVEKDRLLALKTFQESGL